MSSKYLFAAIKLQGLNPAEKVLLLCLADVCNEVGEATPGFSYLMECTGLSRSSLKRTIKACQDKGILQRERVFAEGIEIGSKYRVQIEPTGSRLDSNTTYYNRDISIGVQIEPTRFKKPTVEEVSQYVKEANLRYTSANAFWDYWESMGWRRKSGTMKDWKASCRQWDRQQKDWGKQAINGSEDLREFM